MMEVLIPILVMCSIASGLAVLLAVADKYIASYGECKLIINKDTEITVEGGDTLLSYLIDNEIYMPSACGGKGTCGYCKLKVLEGGGTVLPTETPFLTKHDIAQAVRLACQVKVKKDVELGIPDDLLAAQQFKTVIEIIEDLTHDIKRIVFKLIDPEKIEFKAGQYVQFCIPETTEYRAYSVASQPSIADRIELMIRHIPGGLCSGYVHECLEEGDEIFLTGAYGDFYLREESTKDIICVAGGCGMAPIRSIVKHLHEKGSTRKITYFFGARQKRDLFCTEELRAIEKEFPNFKYIPALSEPISEDDWDGEVGLITATMQKHMKHDENQEAYLCGPPPMLEAAVKVLTAKGVSKSDIYYDEF